MKAQIREKPLHLDKVFIDQLSHNHRILIALKSPRNYQCRLECQRIRRSMQQRHQVQSLGRRSNQFKSNKMILQTSK